MKKSALAGVFIGLIFLAGCLELQPPQVTYQDTKVSIISVQELNAKASFSIKNPNPIGLNGNVEYDLSIDGKPFTSGITSTIEMPASGQTTFVLESRVDLVKVFGTLSNILTLVAQGKTSVPYNIDGKFKSSVVGFPVEAPVKASGNLPLPKLSDIKITF
ncbi:MAG: LEA type 2 family protein [Candidatus Margulisiibacteriota bacterium]